MRRARASRAPFMAEHAPGVSMKPAPRRGNARRTVCVLTLKSSSISLMRRPSSSAVSTSGRCRKNLYLAKSLTSVGELVLLHPFTHSTWDAPPPGKISLQPATHFR